MMKKSQLLVRTLFLLLVVTGTACKDDFLNEIDPDELQATDLLFPESSWYYGADADSWLSYELEPGYRFLDFAVLPSSSDDKFRFLAVFASYNDDDNGLSYHSGTLALTDGKPGVIQFDTPSSKKFISSTSDDLRYYFPSVTVSKEGNVLIAAYQLDDPSFPTIKIGTLFQGTWDESSHLITDLSDNDLGEGHISCVQFYEPPADIFRYAILTIGSNFIYGRMLTANNPGADGEIEWWSEEDQDYLAYDHELNMKQLPFPRIGDHTGVTTTTDFSISQEEGLLFDVNLVGTASYLNVSQISNKGGNKGLDITPFSQLPIARNYDRDKINIYPSIAVSKKGGLPDFPNEYYVSTTYITADAGGPEYATAVGFIVDDSGYIDLIDDDAKDRYAEANYATQINIESSSIESNKLFFLELHQKYDLNSSENMLYNILEVNSSDR